MTAQELKETGQRLFKAGQYSDAIPLLKSAAEAFPNDELLWSDLVLAAHYGGQYEQAVEFAKQGIRHQPRSDWLWRQLGNELTQIDRLEEAKKALDNARSLNPNVDWLWRYLAALHRKGKNLEKEIEALENLYELGEATGTDLNQLGIAYHNQKPPNFAKALDYYRLSVETEPSVQSLFNMGLVFNDPEVSQDSDAADAYRRALALQPDYEPARERLDTTMRKLVPLAERALAVATGLVQSDDMFHFYFSPFEVLQIEAVETVEELDVKVIQRAKKRLLQEIKLNDGKVSWLADYPLDMSRALARVDELDDKAKKRYHWAVFQNKRLLGFLTQGDIRHFLYADDYFPHETLELLDEEPEFRAFLSKPFARQYNLVLTRAIERRLLPVVEVLFDGRRWVEPADEDICFEGAFKRIGDLVELMRSKAAEGRARKVSLQEIEDFLRQHSFPELFNLLPTAFASAQGKVVAEIRSLAISCFNEHDDADLSRGILNICKGFTFRSVELTKRLGEDFKAIEEIISEQQRNQESYNESGVGTQYVPNWVFAGKRNQKSYNKSKLWWVVIPAIVIIVWVINLFDSTETAPSEDSYTPPSAYRPSSYSQPSAPGTSTSKSKTVYRVPSYMEAELERDSRLIDSEKAKAEQMASQLENLEREIKQKQLYLNQESQLDIDEFNRKVNTYNGLLERARAQNRLVNQLVESYNKKLRQHGR